jgi:hypothetical protein
VSEPLFDMPRIMPVKLSAGQRRTVKARLAIAAGKHPANGLPIDTTHTCNDCVHLHRYEYHNRTYIKCPNHRLGESHSEASDMRAGWPACSLFKAPDD